jgi:hypothetical protein
MVKKLGGSGEQPPEPPKVKPPKKVTWGKDHVFEYNPEEPTIPVPEKQPLYDKTRADELAQEHNLNPHPEKSELKGIIQRILAYVLSILGVQKSFEETIDDAKTLRKKMVALTERLKKEKVMTPEDDPRVQELSKRIQTLIEMADTKAALIKEKTISEWTQYWEDNRLRYFEDVGGFKLTATTTAGKATTTEEKIEEFWSKANPNVKDFVHTEYSKEMYKMFEPYIKAHAESIAVKEALNQDNFNVDQFFEENSSDIYAQMLAGLPEAIRNFLPS